MNRIILWIFVFITTIQITYAIPLPALVLGMDFLLFIIPVTLSIFTAVYFYFRKYILYINIYLFILSSILYIFHFFYTKQYFIYGYEYIIWIIIMLWFVYTWIFQKWRIIHYLLVFFLILVSIFLSYTSINLYKSIHISQCIEDNIYSNVVITDIFYKDNFFLVEGYDNESKLESYVVVWVWEWVNHCTKKWKYFVCTGWNRWLWKWLSTLAYQCIKE